MKYSFLKHQWHKNAVNMIASDNVDKKYYYGVFYTDDKKSKESLKSTDLSGGLILGDSYILSAKILLFDVLPSCLLSLERKGNQKLSLCFEPAGEDAITMTLTSANIPDGTVHFGYKIYNNNNLYKLLIAVSKTGVSLLSDCDVVEEKQFRTNISTQVHLTDDMDLSVAYPLTSGNRFSVSVRDLDLYSPIDVTTLLTICPNLPSAQLPGENSPKGDKGEKGDTGPKGDTGCKGEAVKSRTGPMALTRPKRDKEDKGFSGTNTSPACNAEQDAIRSIATAVESIASSLKQLNDYIVEKTEQTKQLTEHITTSNERIANVEQSIQALKTAMLKESQP